MNQTLHLHWRTGTIFCRIFGLLLFTSNSVSILTLCLIALGRYLLIAHPKLFPQVFSAKGIVLALVGSWVVGVTSFAPLWNVFVLVPVVCTCSFDRVRGRPYTTILMVIYFVVGLSSVGVFYCLIHRQVKRAARALDQYGLKQASIRSHQVAGTHEAMPGHFQELDSGLASRGPSEGISSEPVSAATTQTLEGDSPEAGSQGIRKAAQQITERSLPEVHRKAREAAGARKATDAPSEFGKVTRMCFAVFLCFVLSYIPFLLLNILERTAGPSYYVEYLIRESPCTKSQASCSLQPSDSEPVGICQGSLGQGSPSQFPLTRPLEKIVTVTCEFFESQAQVPGGENPADTQGPMKVPQKNTAAPTSSPSITAPRGSIQHLPDLDVEKPEDSKTESPEEILPVQLDLTTNPQGDTVDVSFLYLEPEEKKLVVLPFPGNGQRSAECPGPAEENNPLILPP